MRKPMSLALVCLAFSSNSWAPALADELSPKDSLATVNELFRSVYSASLKEELGKGYPVILVGSGKLVLLKDAKRQEVEYIPEQYRILKTIDHIPLAVFVLLTNHTGVPLSSETASSLRRLQDLLAAAGAQIKSAGLKLHEVERGQRILAGVAKFVEKCLKNQTVSRKELEDFCRGNAGALLDNAYDAVSLELGALHTQVMRWKADMTPPEWQKVHVVITGGHMPRTQERELQYFERLLGQREEGRRIIYMETPGDEAAALDLLGKHLMDASIGEAFFADRMRMHRDLLSDAARRYLKEHDPAAAGR